MSSFIAVKLDIWRPVTDCSPMLRQQKEAAAENRLTQWPSDVIRHDNSAETLSIKGNPTPHPLPLLKLRVERPARRRSGRGFLGWAPAMHPPQKTATDAT